MRDDRSGPRLTLRVVYKDLPDLIEVETRVATNGWAGVACAYTSPGPLAETARGLLHWAERPAGGFALQAGADTGIGWLSLRWQALNRAGRLECEVRMATSADDSDNREDVWRLRLKFPTNPASVDRFAQELIALAETQVGAATLTGD